MSKYVLLITCLFNAGIASVAAAAADSSDTAALATAAFTRMHAATSAEVAAAEKQEYLFDSVGNPWQLNFIPQVTPPDRTEVMLATIKRVGPVVSHVLMQAAKPSRALPTAFTYTYFGQHGNLLSSCPSVLCRKFATAAGGAILARAEANPLVIMPLVASVERVARRRLKRPRGGGASDSDSEYEL